jgi:hypothetical protein
VWIDNDPLWGIEMKRLYSTQPERTRSRHVQQAQEKAAEL